VSLPCRHVCLLNCPAFCDVWAHVPSRLSPSNVLTSKYLLGADVKLSAPETGGIEITFKLLSVDPASYDDAPSEGIRRLLQIVWNRDIPTGDALQTDDIGKTVRFELH